MLPSPVQAALLLLDWIENRDVRLDINRFSVEQVWLNVPQANGVQRAMVVVLSVEKRHFGDQQVKFACKIHLRCIDFLV